MIRPGDKVLVTATTAFYAFIDGLVGRASGYSPEGLVIVEVTEFEETLEGAGYVTKQFYVPAEQLRLTV